MNQFFNGYERLVSNAIFLMDTSRCRKICLTYNNNTPTVIIPPTTRENVYGKFNISGAYKKYVASTAVMNKAGTHANICAYDIHSYNNIDYSNHNIIV